MHSGFSPLTMSGSGWFSRDQKIYQTTTEKSDHENWGSFNGSIALLWHNAKVLSLFKVKCEMH